MIEQKLGLVMGISTLAAAGFGNLISDVAVRSIPDRYSEPIIE
eukprot:SAG11_NODE_8639_length_992_cov_1.609183_1_plen_43_part_00